MATLQRLALRGTPKATKAAARYTPAGGAERCGMCRHYVPSSSCARIEGPVSAAGWCQLYSQQVTWRPRAGQAAGGGVPAGLTLDLSFMTPGTLPSGVVFTRASTATYFDAAGVMQTATTNTPRWDYDPVTHVLNGLLIEESRINVLLNSATLNTQSVTVTAQQYYLSFTGTGTITKSGTASGALVGTGAGQRVSQTFTPTAGSLTLTVTGSVTNAQLEAGQFVTSYIPTTAAAVTRAQDSVSMPTSGWLTATTSGSLLTEYIINGIRTGFPVIVRLDDGTAANNISHLINSTPGRMYSSSTVASVAGWALGNNSTYTANVVHKMATAWDVGVQRFNLNGIQPQSSVVASATPPSLTNLHIGQDQAGSIFKSMYIRRVAYWPRALSAAELASVTT